MGQGTVLLEWVCQLPWKQQSVLLSSLRGPDTQYMPKIKKITRWLRGITQNNADVQHSYMKREDLPTWLEIEKEFEFSSVHFAFHFLHGLQIVAYKHPDEAIRRQAGGYYRGLIAEVLHLRPESEAAMDERLRDID